MHRTRPALLGLALLAALAPAAPANADVTLGSAAVPSGSSPAPCPPGAVIAQLGENPSAPYLSPGVGRITQWQVNTASATPGTPVSFVVLRTAGGGTYRVVGIDTRSLPSPLPAGGVATFPIASPIAVSAGDTLGLRAGIGVTCFWNGGTIPTTSNLTALSAPALPAPDQVLSPIAGPSPPAYTMNVAANWAPNPAKKKKKCKKKKAKKGAAETAKKKCKKKKGKRK